MTSLDSMDSVTKIDSAKSETRGNASISQPKPDSSFSEPKKNQKSSSGKWCLGYLCSRHRKSDKSEKIERGVEVRNFQVPAELDVEVEKEDSDEIHHEIYVAEI